MKIAVCDDELLICRSISEQIQRLYPAFEVLEYARGEDLIENAAGLDIIFLDIRLDGMDGMETAKRLRQSGSKAVLIFLTALEEYVFQAFDVEAYHYLLKPIDKEKFYRILELAVKRAQEMLLDKREENSILIKSGAVTRKFPIDEIIYAEVQNHKITVHSTEGSMEYYGKLSELQEELGEDFICPHRSYLVNFSYISSYCASSITMDNGAKVLLAKKRYGSFVKQYLQYMKRQKKYIASSIQRDSKFLKQEEAARP